MATGVDIGFVFPGQGSQKVGMGKDLAENFAVAKAVFDEIDEALGQNLSSIMWQGPDDQLLLTENAQPALMAVSMAVVRVLEAEYGLAVAGTAKCVAGHSLGEYSALAAAGVFSLADTARLLKIRGQAMQAATPVGTGAMAALLGLDFADAEAIAQEAAGDEVCQAANDNAPGQVVVSGSKAAVERACVLAKEKGAKRAIMLPVSAPFHCALMAPAAEAMAKALADVEMTAPSVPLVANVSTNQLTDSADIRDSLVAQVTGTVRWRESVGKMATDGIGLFVELGAGKVLTGMMRRNAPDAKAIAIGAPNDFAKAIEEIKSGRESAMQ